MSTTPTSIANPAAGGSISPAPSTSPPTFHQSIPGVKVLLLGASGSGKTHSIRTLVEAGLEVFVLFTEPGMEVLADIPASKLHWHYIPPASPDWAAMIDSANKINLLSLKALSDMSDINKGKYKEFLDVLQCLSNFKDDRTGQFFGAVDDWDGRRVLVVDSLSGLSIMAMNLIAGSKPVKNIADWGVSVDNLERLTTKLCVDTRCHFVLTAHLERETDEVTGGTTLMASTLGRKLAPKLPRFFSDVIHVKRSPEGGFVWSTVTSGVDTKTRSLPLSDKLAPTFAPIIAKWRERNAQTAAISPPSI
jgi:hypothetical protein